MPAALVDQKQRRGSRGSRTAKPPSGFRDNGRDRRHGRHAVDLACDRDDGQRRTPAALRVLIAPRNLGGRRATRRADEQTDTARGQLTPKACPDHRRPESNDPAGDAGAGCRRTAREPTKPRGRGAPECRGVQFKNRGRRGFTKHR